MKKLFIPILCAVLLLTGCTKIPTTATGEEIIAKMDGKDITAEELYQTLKKNSGYTSLMLMIDEHIASKEVEQEGADEYVTSQIDAIKEECEANGYDYNEFLAYYGYASEDALKETIKYYYNQDKVALKYVQNNMITDKEIDAYYKDNIFGEQTVRYILVTPTVTDNMTDDEKSTAKAGALEKANTALNLINKYAGDDLESYFKTLVETYSDDAGTKKTGGLLTNFVKSDSGIDEAFWNTSYKLKNGEVSSKPISTTYGYYIIYKVSSKDKPELETVKESITAKLAEEKLTADSTLVNTAWVEIRKSYNLEIVDSEINATYKDSIKKSK